MRIYFSLILSAVFLPCEPKPLCMGIVGKYMHKPLATFWREVTLCFLALITTHNRQHNKPKVYHTSSNYQSKMCARQTTALVASAVIVSDAEKYIKSTPEESE